MHDFRDLILQCGHQIGVGMTECIDGDTAQSVEVSSARLIEQNGALAPREGNGLAQVGRHQGGLAGHARV